MYTARDNANNSLENLRQLALDVNDELGASAYRWSTRDIPVGTPPATWTDEINSVVATKDAGSTDAAIVSDGVTGFAVIDGPTGWDRNYSGAIASLAQPWAAHYVTVSLVNDPSYVQNASYQFFANSAQEVNIYAGTLVNTTETWPSGRAVVSLRADGTSTYIWINGVQYGPYDAGTGATGAQAKIFGVGGGGNMWDGNAAEWIVTPVTGNEATVQDALNAVWQCY